MSKQKFYITTPIYYPSGNLHIGHAYTTVAADSMNRYKKMRGFDSYFLTGTDEHGQKIQRRAAEAGQEPQEFVDGIVAKIQELWGLMGIEYDDFIRTTQERHQEVAQKIFQKISDQGDIYKAEYSGWYCSPCETFFTERQLAEGHLCPDCGRPVEVTKEESYFFKMSKYADRWLQFIEDNPDFIQPATRRNEMVNFVKQGLDDLCVSRTTFDWGIKVPFDDKHVIYVWFDALINYISALGYGTDHDELYQKYWPADIHLMAKDIIRFHSIIWPIMLMALDIPIPKKVIAHGWVTLGDCGKMSKSKGNVIDPALLVKKYSLDTIRYFLLREMPFGLDVAYSEEALVNRINIDLANDYGNLLSRLTSMIGKFQNKVVLAPDGETEFDKELIELAKATPAAAAAYFDNLDFSAGLAEVMKLVGKANKYVDDTAPWALNKAGEKGKLASVLYNLCEVLRLVSILLKPVMIETQPKVFAQLGIEGREDLGCWEALQWGLFPAGTEVKRGEPIFPRIDFAAELAAEEAEEEAAAAEPVVEYEPLGEEIGIEDFAKLDLRVVTVLDCQKVPKTDKLLQFTVKMGEETRSVLSGIAKYYQPEQLIGKKLILIANLKPAKIRGIESQGMLLSAVLGEDLELLAVEKIADGSKVC
ncbi:MAG: methionine--tRNA ligase [Clostridia bacterium]|nr:methionine--tRNA ligase [Clostridia bacterium]